MYATYATEEDDIQDMEWSELDVSVDRVLEGDENRAVPVTRFGRRALVLGLAVVVLVAASVCIAVALRKNDQPKAIPSDMISSAPSDSTISTSTLIQHNNVDSCWMVLNGNVYNMTSYNHPGPQTLVFGQCGTDATVEYAAFHPQVYMRTIDRLYLGVYEVESGPVNEITGNTEENYSSANNTTQGPMSDKDSDILVPNNSSNSPSTSSSVAEEGPDENEDTDKKDNTVVDEDDTKDDADGTEPVDGGIFGDGEEDEDDEIEDEKDNANDTDEDDEEDDNEQEEDARDEGRTSTIEDVKDENVVNDDGKKKEKGKNKKKDKDKNKEDRKKDEKKKGEKY